MLRDDCFAVDTWLRGHAYNVAASELGICSSACKILSPNPFSLVLCSEYVKESGAINVNINSIKYR